MEPVLIFTALLTIAMIVVLVLDLVHYVIPNTLNLAIFALYPFAAYILQLDWMMALAAAGIMLAIGLAIFSLGLMGGGDVKLLVALVLWTGWHKTTLQFLGYTAILGGILVVLVVIARYTIGPLWARTNKDRHIPRILRNKQPVPYGIAIALAFLYVLYIDHIPGLS